MSLDALPPGVTELLVEDTYLSINSCSPGRGKSRLAPDLPAGKRDAGAVTHLNAVYCDIDSHNRGLNPGDVIGQVIALQDARQIPPVSLFINSGRGVWCLWLLVDDSTRFPPVKTREKERQYARVQTLLHARLSHLGADPNARDIARCVRLAGSINSKSGTVVTYMPQLDLTGKAFEYTLDDLENQLKVVEPAVTPVEPAVAPVPMLGEGPLPLTRRTNRKTDWEEVNTRRLNAFRKLEALRGGFAEGIRNEAVWIFAVLLFLDNPKRVDIPDEIQRFGDRCVPPLTKNEVRQAVLSVRKRYTPRTSIIRLKLGITPVESALIGWERRPYVTKGLSGITSQQVVEAGERREAIVKATKSAGGERLSYGQMQKKLESCGFRVTRWTVRNDYRKLGWMDT